MNIIDKVESITEGWKNFVFKNNEVEQVAKERAEICIVCPHRKEIAIELRNENIGKLACDICDCPLSSKLRSMMESCPDGRWEAKKIGKVKNVFIQVNKKSECSTCNK